MNIKSNKNLLFFVDIKDFSNTQIYINSLSDNGTEIITPFPVPIHRRLDDMRRAVIRTNEKNNFPVPAK